MNSSNPLEPAHNTAPDLERERFAFGQRMEEAALALREREHVLQEAKLTQQKAEWEHTCRIAETEKSAVSARARDEGRLQARLIRAFTAFIPLFLTLLPVAWGYVQYLESMRDMARASVANARNMALINASTERFKAVLDIKKDFFKRQDKVFEDILRVSSAINHEVGRFETDDTPREIARDAPYRKWEDEFERMYFTSAAFVGSETVNGKMVLFHNGLVYLHHPTNENYAYLNRQWQAEHTIAGTTGIVPGGDLPRAPADLISALTQELSFALQSVVEMRSNPKQYPFLFASGGSELAAPAEEAAPNKGN